MARTLDAEFARRRPTDGAAKRTRRPLDVFRFGVVPYGEALALQSRVHARVVARDAPDTLLLLEHPHTYTLGRRGRDADILIDRAELERLGVEVYHTDRGGEVTYHGPGQIVGYPIIDLRRWGGGPLKYVRCLERAIIATLAEFGIEAESAGRPTGVWARDRKIAAIGVKVARRVTTHGFALNVSTDLRYFDDIIPCGMPGAGVTSVSAELGRTVSVDEVIPSMADHFARSLGLDSICIRRQLC